MKAVNYVIKKSILFLSLVFLFLMGCSNPSSGSTPMSDADVVLTITDGGASVDTSKNLCTAYPGYFGRLVASLADSSATTFTWTSSNPDAVSVDSNGNVTYKGAGDNYDAAKATITCTAANGNSATVECWSSFYPQFTIGGIYADFDSDINLSFYGGDNKTDYRVFLFYYTTKYTEYTNGFYGDCIGYNPNYMSYSSSNTSVINFRNGDDDTFVNLVPGNPGKAEITITINGITKKCNIIIPE